MNDFQQASEVPLLGAMDAEWGLGCDWTIPFSLSNGSWSNTGRGSY